MKELSIEEKAKRYDEVVARLRYAFNSNRCTLGFMNEILRYPKESEDEKVRKKLINLVKKSYEQGGYALHKWEADEMLAWLEKQGKIDEDLIAKKFLINKGYPIDANGTFPTYEELYNIIREGLEKQGEQKPFDYENVNIQQKDFAPKKPKFNVGDWIVNKGHSYLIADIDYDDNRYLFEIGGYTHEQLNWEYINNADKKYHLWTIQDAKDGDVLVTCFEEDNIIIMYHSRCTIDTINVHCCLDNKFVCENLGVFDAEDVKPATKEQRDLLFSKMHEAGYEWDAEKKELKKIDNEEVNGEDYGIDGIWHAQRILEKTLGSVDGYQSDDGILSHKCAITAVKKLHKQKPTDWSEEDSVRLQRIIDFLWYNRKGDTDAIYQQEQDIDWLKNFNQRVTWKPSDEQITVLELASKYERVFTPKQIDILIGLKEQLKKLKK